MTVTTWFQRQADAYKNGHDRPLGGYVVLMGVYGGGTALAAALAKALGRTPPDRLGPWDVAQLAIATHKVARTIAKDPITSPLRAPVTTYAGTSAPAELKEEVRGEGLQHSLGELVTCPMCMGQWVATGFMLGLTIAPKLTRTVITTFTAVSAADFLQYLYAGLQQAESSE
jgi:hypothetical protein